MTGIVDPGGLQTFQGLGTFTPTLAQGGTPIATSTAVGRYALLPNRLCWLWLNITASAAGTSGIISVESIPASISPKFLASNVTYVHGAAQYWDVGSRVYQGTGQFWTASTMFFPLGDGTSVFGVNPAVVVASTDKLAFNGVYELVA